MSRRSLRGSPPLAREQPPGGVATEGLARITPARAGTTFCVELGEQFRRDHPRSRGNNYQASLQFHPVRGSPPLAREQRLQIIGICLVPGITPARAGTTKIIRPFWPGAEDHPRSRGNNTFRRGSECATVGSPPLAREQQTYFAPCKKDGGITPARAGTTPICFDFRPVNRDHPRSRGNNSRHQ